MNNLKRVSKEEFDDFLNNYPNKLIRDKMRICEPEITSFLDKSIQSDKASNEFYSAKVVAKIVHEWLKDGKKDKGRKFWEYSILSEKQG